MDTPLSPQPDPAPLWRWRALHCPRLGNAEQEYEDAFAFHTHGAAAVADGASEGIFARRWATLLAESYTASRPDLDDDGAYTAWLAECRRAWVADIDFAGLRWSQQNKVERTGAGATFLGLRLTPVPTELAAAVEWHAWAVGDSCLFWVREGRLLETFPELRGEDFGLTPALLRTKTDVPDPAPQSKGGRLCLPGDLLVLATDAVAQWALRGYEAGDPPDWDLAEWSDEGDWRDGIDGLRRADRIVNDDCTVLLVRILPDAPPAGA